MINEKDFDIFSLPASAKIHFIGIGGISMSGLAQILLKRGYNVTGSDRNESEIVKKLKQLGAHIYIGPEAQNVDGASLVVHTAAVHDDNPEMKAAKEQNIPLITRAVCLGSIMKHYKYAVGVSGTHGKTTTTSMLAHALIHAQKDPTISVGGELDIIGGNIKVGQSDYFVTEACEYTNSFLHFFPTVALITNIEEDHLDFFSGIDEIIESFRKFALLTKGKGKVVAMGADKNVQKAIANIDCDTVTYAIDGDYDYTAANIVYKGGFAEFDVMKKNVGKLCTVSLHVPGDHNILNALATIAVCDCLGIDAETAAKGIETFKGTHRRFEYKGKLGGAVVIDDYAHHPTEIKATLTAAKAFDHNKLWCVFQPHTYTRTKTLWNEFVTAFDNVDELIITDIYAAREQPDGVTKPENLVRDIKARGVNARYIKEFADIEKVLKDESADGDMIFTMGAGNVVEIGEQLVK